MIFVHAVKTILGIIFGNWIGKEKISAVQSVSTMMIAVVNMKISDDWNPTPENINSLPDPVRSYIHDLSTLCDPTGIVQENILLKDSIKSLEIKVQELENANL